VNESTRRNTMSESDKKNAESAASSPTSSSPDELIKDLELTEEQQRSVVGGKGTKGQEEYLVIKMTDVIITSV